MSAEKKLTTTSRQFMTGILTMAMLLMSGASLATQADRDMAKRIHDRLAGVPPTEAMLDTMESCYATDTTACDAEVAGATASADASIKVAYIAMKNTAFYNTTLKNFATPWTNEAQSVFYEFNDYSATVIGMIRDDEDFRELLFADYLYVGANPANYSISNNQMYIDMEDRGVDLSSGTELQQVAQQSLPGRTTIEPAGIFTTRAAARAFFEGGTNRAMTRFTFLNHLCHDMEQVKDITRPSDRIRQDVSRSPGGDSRLFMNSCIGCHAGMDPLTQAFAFYEWQYTGEDIDGGQLVFTDNSVQMKNLINSTNFEPGFVTEDDTWTNYWRNGPNSVLGWNYAGGADADNGEGPASMGRELAYSKAFASCQVRKAFKSVCLRDPMSNKADRVQVNNVLADIAAASGQINMKNVFAEMATYCEDGSAYTPAP